jgi:hypothetical protein
MTYYQRVTTFIVIAILLHFAGVALWEVLQRSTLLDAIPGDIVSAWEVVRHVAAQQIALAYLLQALYLLFAAYYTWQWGRKAYLCTALFFITLYPQNLFATEIMRTALQYIFIGWLAPTVADEFITPLMFLLQGAAVLPLVIGTILEKPLLQLATLLLYGVAFFQAYTRDLLLIDILTLAEVLVATAGSVYLLFSSSWVTLYSPTVKKQVAPPPFSWK